MRIAFIVDQFPALSETFILNQITGLIDRGHEVDIYSDRPGNTSKIHPAVEQYQLLKRTYAVTVPNNYLERIIKGILLFSANFFQAPKTLLRALNFIKYNRSCYGEPAGFLKPLYLIIPWLNKAPYEIILCHYGRNGLKASLFKDLAVIEGKIIVAFHGYDISRYLDIHGKDIYQHLFNRADLLLPISQYWQQKLVELGCDRSKIMVHHMGIDCNQFNCFTTEPALTVGQNDDNSLRLISVARLVAKKGLQYSIEAVAQLIPRYPQLEYQIIGDGVLRADLEQLIEQLNVGKNIKLLGWQKQQQVAKAIALADIVLAPSITSENGDCEGIPVSLMEAMAKGLPVISTYHSGIPELIDDGVSGYLLPEREVDDLASKIDHLIINPKLRQVMGQSGRFKVENDYNIDLLNDRLIEICLQLIHFKNS